MSRGFEVPESNNTMRSLIIILCLFLMSCDNENTRVGNYRYKYHFPTEIADVDSYEVLGCVGCDTVGNVINIRLGFIYMEYSD